MTLKTSTLPISSSLVVLFFGASVAFAAASPVIVPPLPPTVPSANQTVADMSPVIVPPLPPTVPPANLRSFPA